MKNFITIIILFMICISNAQVGIGTTEPKATMDITVND